MILDPKKSYTYFKNRFVMRRSTNGFFVFDCPFCIDGEDKRKHAVNFDWGICKCWVCGFKGYITDFVQDYENVGYVEAKDMLWNSEASAVDLEILEYMPEGNRAVEGLELPTGFTSILDGDTVIGMRARKYLQGRGFDLELMDAQGYGYCREHDEDKKKDYFGYIIIPYKRRGQLYWFQGRDFMGNFLRYKNPPNEQFGIGKGDILFNEDALELATVNYLTEGWADALTMGIEGVSTQGWSVSRDQKDKLMRSRARRLVFLPDVGMSERGITFYQQAVKLAMEFIDIKECKVVDFEKSGLVGKDVNDYGKEAVLELVEKTPVLTEGLAYDILID